MSDYGDEDFEQYDDEGFEVGSVTVLPCLPHTSPHAMHACMQTRPKMHCSSHIMLQQQLGPSCPPLSHMCDRIPP